MEKYFVNDNAQSNGDHEVHKDGCKYLAMAHRTTYLGYFSNCRDAVIAAKRIYLKSDGCATCSPACHTS